MGDAAAPLIMHVAHALVSMWLMQHGKWRAARLHRVRACLHACRYGSYEISIDPYFSSSRLSLLDRGVVYAIAHIRGGGEMGR